MDPVDHAQDVWDRRYLTDEEERLEELAEQNRADEHLAFLLELDAHEVNDQGHATREEERNQ